MGYRVATSYCIGVPLLGLAQTRGESPGARHTRGTMSHPSKDKGNRFERELVAMARALGIPAERAYASNGLALGHNPEVDCVVAGQRIQAKCRAKIADYLHIPDGCDAVVFRQTTGPIPRRRPLVLMDYQTYLEMIREKETVPNDARVVDR